MSDQRQSSPVSEEHQAAQAVYRALAQQAMRAHRSDLITEQSLAQLSLSALRGLTTRLRNRLAQLTVDAA